MAAPPSPPRQAPRPYPFYLGGVAASIAACFTHPLDMVKTRMQNSHDPSVGMLRFLSRTARDEGVRGLYVGLSASLCRQMSYSLVRFGAYDALKAQALASQPAEADGSRAKVLPAWKMALCASAAGAVGGVAGNWADVLLVRMTSDVLKPPAERFGYRNALTGLADMVRSEGPSSLFRGLTPNVTRAVLMNASQLATYDIFKGWLLASGYYKEGTWLHFSASFFAGTVATTICSPADVIKARVMSAGSNGGGGSIVSSLKTAFATEGPGFLFRGWTPAWVRLSPNTILIFVTLEKLKQGVDKLRETVGEGEGEESRSSTGAAVLDAKETRRSS